MVNRDAVKKILDRVLHVTAFNLIVIRRIVIRKRYLRNRGINLYAADTELIDLSHRIAVDLDSRALLCIIIEYEKHQEVGLNAAFVRSGGLGTIIFIQADYQKGFYIILIDVILTIVSKNSVIGARLGEPALSTFPNLQQQKSGSYEKNEHKCNNYVFSIIVSFHLSHNRSPFV